MPIRVAVIPKRVYSDSKYISVYHPNLVESIAKIVSKVEDDTKSTRNKQIHKAYRKIAVTHFQHVLKEFEKLGPEVAAKLKTKWEASNKEAKTHKKAT
jgi:hypothetical protein